jgi:hypothetical protein
LTARSEILMMKSPCHMVPRHLNLGTLFSSSAPHIFASNVTNVSLTHTRVQLPQLCLLLLQCKSVKTGTCPLAARAPVAPRGKLCRPRRARFQLPKIHKCTPQTGGNLRKHVVQPEFLADETWLWSDGEGDWRYAMSIDGNVYRTADVLPLLARLNFNNPNSLEAAMAHNTLPHPFMNMYMDAPRLINIPSNRVQDNFPNRHADSSRRLVKHLRI